MATKVMNKKKFIEWLDKQITDDQIILLSQDLEGNLTVNKKRNVKKVTFGFAADAFKRKNDIGHFAFGKTPVLAFSVCEKSDVTEETIKLSEL